MKTIKGPAIFLAQFIDTKPPFNAIRTPDVIMKSAEKFRKGTGFNLPIPIVKKKTKIKTV